MLSARLDEAVVDVVKEGTSDMTRINTNVSSLNAQKTLARSNTKLQEALTRLSTGLRINVGKDDPAGLIASEVLRSDIISVERAITNSQRANQMIGTADSALGQVSSLLNDVRGLVSEAANTGAMSVEQISANQLQIDSSLEAIDRIAQVTQFQGKRLLDGSLDFVTAGVDNSKITDLQIDQGNFGSQNEIGIAVEVVTQATRGQLTYQHGAIAEAVVLEIGGRNGFEAFSFAGGSTIAQMAAAINLVADALGVTAEVQTAATAGTITTSSYGADNDISITADTAGEDEGNIRVKFTADNSAAGSTATTATYVRSTGNDPGTLDVELQTEAWSKGKWQVNGDLDSSADDAFTIESKIFGAQNEFEIKIADAGAGLQVTYDHDGGTGGIGLLTINVDVGVGNSPTELKAAIEGNARLNSLFTVDDTVLDGTGGVDFTVAADASKYKTRLATAVTGGTIQATANDVVAEINDATKNAALAGDVTAALATGNDGHELVTAFQESAFYGTAAANNRLQFLAPEGAKNVRFVSTPGQALAVDLATEPEGLGFSSAIVQGLEAGTSFKITAKQKGAEYDDIEIVMVDQATANLRAAVWDPVSKKLTINADINGADDIAAVIGYINNNDAVSPYFRAELWGTTDGTTQVDDTDFTGTVATTSGGVVSEGTVIINLETDANGIIQTSASELLTFFDDTANHSAAFKALGLSVSNAEGSDGSGMLGATLSDLVFATSGTDLQDKQASGDTYALNGEDASLKITAVNRGATYNDVVVEFEDTATAGAETFTYDPILKKLTIGIESGVTTPHHINDPTTGSWTNTTLPGYDAELAALFTMADGVGGNGSAVITSASDFATLSGGVEDAGQEEGASLLGNEDQANTGLAFKAVQYGSDEFVSVRALNGTSFSVVDSAGTSTDRAVGTDVDARLNGIQAVGTGLTAVINTSALDLTFSLDSDVADGEALTFTIVSGGAQFQLGPDVVSNQQARLGISSVNTAKLGGVAGRLFEVRSGGSKDLKTDVIGAASVIEEVITQITTLRGRLGAFQRTTLETNIQALADTLEALTEAESSIRDTDFAKESANLTKAQILVQSGLSVLTIANSNPQSVLALLQR